MDDLAKAMTEALDDTWGDLFADTFEAILRDGKSPSDVAGSTSLRAGIGLAFDVLDQTTTLTEDEAWAYLDEENAATVRFLKSHYAAEIETWRGQHVRL